MVKNIEIRDGKAEILGECILCGHCVAICPHCAAAILAYDMADVTEYDKVEFSLSPQSLLNAIKFRRSTRQFAEKNVEREKLEMILQAGRYTPTSVNSQDVRFIIVQDELEKAKDLIWQGMHAFADELAEQGDPQADTFLGYCKAFEENRKTDRLFFNANTVIVTAADDPMNGVLATANMELMASSLGLGVLIDNYMVWSIRRSESAKEWLRIGGKTVTSCMLVGYPGVSYKRTAPRREVDAVWR